MADLFVPPRPPSLSVQTQVGYRILRTDFGDGYSQRAKDGINSINREWSLVWANLTMDDANTITAFFDQKGGAEAFVWTAPRDSTARLWICTGHSREIVDANRDTVTARFELVYDLQTAAL